MTSEEPGNADEILPRRRFLSEAGTAALALSLADPALLRGTAASSKIEIGVIGLGGRGHWIARLFQRHGGFQITAVADYFESVARAVGEKLGVPENRRFHGLSGYKRLIESKVDAVVLETPPYCFPEHVGAAVEAGCHVFMAKPVACDVHGCRIVEQMAARAQREKKVFLIDFQTRTEPLIIAAVARLRRGDIGKIGMLDSIYTDEGFRDPPRTETIASRLRHLVWVNDVNLGGGMLVNAGIHMVDLALWMAGDRLPRRAVGSGRTAKPDPHGDTCDLYSLTYEFDDGLVLNHRGDHIRNKTGFRTNATAYCERGFLEASYDGPVRMDGLEAERTQGVVEGLYERGAVRNIATFCESIRHGAVDNPTVRPGIQAALATILGREAARRREAVEMEELLRRNEKLEVDTTGLED